uniref:RCC1 and BTB domain-containing protein 2-like n=1 Tax=Dermatophagoides pteronyssinus TaxID=6956 RepID=A0A6P6YAS2_DERPT
MTRNLKFLPPIKLDNRPRSFSSASLAISSSAITFGLTPFVFEYDDPILKLFNNPDNYDVEFIVDNRSILACKCHLKKESEYYSRMFSGDWKDANKVIIRNYSYKAYSLYLRMLHEEFYGFHIYQSNIAELIDLAHCYNDERLMKHCREFIQKELTQRTLFTYLPLIDKYELDE